MADPGPTWEGAGYSTPKQSILLNLKRSGPRSLADLAHDLGVSRVAVLRHLAALEADGLVERSYRAAGVGRPRAYFRLTDGAQRLFPQAYADMSQCALKFIEERIGRSAVLELLQQRAHDVADANRSKFRGDRLEPRVEELVRVRTDGGYMAEMGARRRQTFEMLEHNCPILAIAREYPEACEIEQRMFSSLLRADVDASHRVVAGDAVCRFVIRPRKEPG